MLFATFASVLTTVVVIISFTIYFGSEELISHLMFKKTSLEELPNKEITILDLNEDEMFLYTFDYHLGTYDSVPWDDTPTAKDIFSESNKFRIKFMENILYSDEKSQRPKSISRLFSYDSYSFSGSNLKYLRDLEKLCNHVVNLPSYVDSDLKDYVRFIYFDFLYPTVKSLYIYNKDLSSIRELRSNSLKSFKVTKESELLEVVKSYVEELKILIEMSEVSYLENTFNLITFEKSSYRFNKISSLIDSINETEESLVNCEVKVIANNLRRDILPTLVDVSKTNMTEKDLKDLESALDKIISILENKDTFNSSKSRESLSIINRYLDSVCNSSEFENLLEK